jgi:hypothetical protein
MPFEVPVASFDAHDHARNKVLRANQLEETYRVHFISSYEDFWGVSGQYETRYVDGQPVTTFVGNGSRYSVEQMQSILDILGATAISIMTAAAGLVQFIEAAYPGALDDRYKAAAFEYTIGQGGITLTKLADAWSEPLVEESEPLVEESEPLVEQQSEE